MPREIERIWEMLDHTVENDREINNRVSKVETELAVIKVKFAIIGCAVGVASSAITTVVVGVVMKALNLK